VSTIEAADPLARRLRDLDASQAVLRLWKKDPSLWTDDPAPGELTDRLGWLDLPSAMRQEITGLRTFANEVRQYFDRVVLLGMGGSSLAPEVLWRAIGPQRHYPTFHMLDSTHPDAVLAVEEEVPVEHTLFVVASKSGTTIETASFFKYFWRRLQERGDRFVAITDPGTPLHALAEECGFRHVFLNPPDVGGRYAALSLFGLAPAAFFGLDVERLLDSAAAMRARCVPDTPASENPGAALGAWMAENALAGRDKLALALPASSRAFGLWIEQLVAESTGKEGKGVLPVVEDAKGDPVARGHDRAVVDFGEEPPAGTGGAHSAHLPIRGRHEYGAEFYRWEMATALAAAILRLNAFDQPNVQESKRRTADALAHSLDPAPGRPTRRSEVQAFTRQIRPGDYVAVGAWYPPTAEHDRRLAQLQTILCERLGVTVTVGYGPRYLHSTGQYHKGGPPTGHFVQLLDSPERDVAVPGEAYSFGQLLAAQARGDAEALAARGRAVLRVHDLDRFLEVL
jgi:glucose-6-phosphate isomerase